MKTKSLFCSVRELTEIILKRQSLDETRISVLKPELEGYSISDRRFVLAVIGIAILKLLDDWQHSGLLERKIDKSLPDRITWKGVKDAESSQNNVMPEYEDPYLFV